MEMPVPAELVGEMEARRAELVERVSEVDDEVAELYLGEQEVGPDTLKAAIRRACIGGWGQEKGEGEGRVVRLHGWVGAGEGGGLFGCPSPRLLLGR